MKRLGVLIAGLNGAVASTLVTGVALMRRGCARPQALMSEKFKKSHALVDFEQFVFGGWDVRDEHLLESALRNSVVERERLQPVLKELTQLKPWSAGTDKIAAF